MAKVVKCAICGTEFTTSKPNKRYCSFSCKEAAARLRRMKWEDNNPAYNREYMKQYRKKEGDSANDK